MFNIQSPFQIHVHTLMLCTLVYKTVWWLGGVDRSRCRVIMCTDKQETITWRWWQNKCVRAGLGMTAVVVKINVIRVEGRWRSKTRRNQMGGGSGGCDGDGSGRVSLITPERAQLSESPGNFSANFSKTLRTFRKFNNDWAAPAGSRGS